MDSHSKFRVNVYIDGFNFYYGLKSNRWRKFYWLDIVKFYELFMTDSQILNKVYYCTATPHDQGKRNRQSAFLKANMLNPKFQIIYGKFLSKEVHYGGNTYTTYEEKQTDVNIAISLIRNIVKSECDTSIIVSGDSDLKPAVDLAKEIAAEHKIYVHFPPRRHSITLEKCCDSKIDLIRYENRFKKCLLPAVVKSGGQTYSCPDNWH